MPSYAKGHIRASNKDHLMQLARARHRFPLLAPVPPPKWDSRAYNWIGPVKDQAQCGSCWDFSGTGICEIAYYKAGLFVADGSQALSEEYTLSCGRNGGCNGDDNVTVLQWAKQTGLPLSSVYGPYTGSRGRCSIKAGSALYKIDDWGFADGGQGSGVTDAVAIKAAIMRYGAVGCAIAADDAFMNNSASAVFDRTTSTDIDHDVILVGWDDSKGKNGAWILRNSWGESWCNSGYCDIGYGVNLVGTEAVWAVVNNPNPPNPFII